MSKSLKMRKLANLAAAVFGAIGATASGQVAVNQLTWVGPNGGHWSEQGNWLDQLSNPVVPGLSSNVRILTPMSGAGAVYTASPMMSSTVRTLTVGAGSALTLTSGSLLIVSDNESGGTVVNEGLIRLQAGTGPDAGQFIELGVPTQLLELGSGVIELEGFHSGIGMTSPFSRTLRLLGTTVRGAGQLGRYWWVACSCPPGEAYFGWMSDRR